MKYIKTIRFIIFFFYGAMTMEAQDLLITSDLDSLNCKITAIKGNNIYFTFKHGEEIRNTLLGVDQVKYYYYNFYPEPEVPEIARKKSDYNHVRIGFQGGFSFRTSKTSPDLSATEKEHVQNSKSGYNYGADFTGYFTEQIGIGIKYSCYGSKANDQNMVDLIKIHFVGPFISTRLLDRPKKNALLMDCGFGYLGYCDNLTRNYNGTTIKGNTIGLFIDIGYDIGITSNVAVGFNLSYMSGTLTNIKVGNGSNITSIKLEKNQYEGLNRIDFSMGIKASF